MLLLLLVFLFEMCLRFTFVVIPRFVLFFFIYFTWFYFIVVFLCITLTNSFCVCCVSLCRRECCGPINFVSMGLGKEIWVYGSRWAFCLDELLFFNVVLKLSVESGIKELVFNFMCPSVATDFYVVFFEENARGIPLHSFVTNILRI